MKIYIKTIFALCFALGLFTIPMAAMHENTTTEVREGDQQKELDELLFEAIEEGDLEKVKKCISDDADIEARNGADQTPLIFAMEEYFHSLFSKRLSPKSIIFKESSENREHIVYWLIKKGADLEATHESSLIMARDFGCVKMMKIIIEQGVSILKMNFYDNADKNVYKGSCSEVRTCLGYLSDFQQELNLFKIDPRAITVAPSHIYLKTLYIDTIYYVSFVGDYYKTKLDYTKKIIKETLQKNNNRYIDPAHCITLFQKQDKSDELKKILDACEFLKCDKNKEKIKTFRKLGLPLDGNELEVQENFLKNIQQSTSFDLNFFYIKNS